MNSISKMLDNSLVRYVLVGGVSFLIEILILFIATEALQLNPVVAVSISFWVGLAIAFLLQKIITFKDTSKSTTRLLWQSIAYGLLVLVNYLFTLAFVSFLEESTSVYVARTVALIITTIWNYVIYSKIIFRSVK